METLKTFFQGALGAMTFGAYHQFTTNKIMEMNNQIMDNKHRNEMEKMEIIHRNEMEKMESQYKLLNEKFEKLISEKEKRWW
jgi:hypothetical protein